MSKYILIYPIKGLVLDKDINEEFKVDKVTFVSKNRLPRIRNRIGLPIKISKLKQKLPSSLNELYFDENETFAICELQINEKNNNNNVIKTIKEELRIIELSQLSFSKRINKHSISLRIGKSEKGSWISINKTTGELSGSAYYLNQNDITPLYLNKHWVNFHKKRYFFKLIKILYGEININEKWKETLKKVALLAGLSQSTNNILQAFIWNFIAIEKLLTRKKDIKKYEDMPIIIENLFGWVPDWKYNKYSGLFKRITNKRHELIHNGNIECIEALDLTFSDFILDNLLFNIVININELKSHKKFIDFIDKIKEEKKSGKQTKKYSKKFIYWNLIYHERDFQKIKERYDLL